MKTTKETIGGTDGRGGFLGKISGLASSIGGIKIKINGKRSNAADANRMAGRQRDNATVAKLRGEDPSAPNAVMKSRESEVESIKNYREAARAAELRKIKAEGGVETVKNQRRTEMGLGLEGASAKVASSKSTLESNLAARDGPEGVANKYQKVVDKRKDTEDGLTKTGVDAKRQEVADTLDAQQKAGIANGQDAEATGAARRKVDNETTVVEPSLRADRTGAEAELAAMRPARPSSDLTLTTRRDALPDKISAAEARRDSAARSAEALRQVVEVGPTSFRTKRGNNNEELNVLQKDNRDRLTPKDTSLRGRKAGLEADLITPKKRSASLGGNIGRRKRDVDEMRKLSDELSARIELAKRGGIPPRPVDTPGALAMKQGNAGISGKNAATTHGSSLGLKNRADADVVRRDGLVSGDMGRLKPKKDEMGDVDTNMDTQTRALDGVGAKRTAANDSLIGAKNERGRAAREADGAAGNMKTAKEKIGGTDGRGGLAGKIGDLMDSNGGMFTKIGGKRKNAADAKRIADREAARAAAAKARGEDKTGVTENNAARNRAADDLNTQRNRALASGKKKSEAEAAATKVKAEAEVDRLRRELDDADVLLGTVKSKIKKGKDDLGDVEANALRLKKETEAAALRKKLAEDDADTNAGAIAQKKRKQDDDEADVEAARKKNEEDNDDVNTARRDLDDETTVAKNKKKEEDDADADPYRPRDDPNAAGLKKRKKEIEDEIELRKRENEQAKRDMDDANLDAAAVRNRKREQDDPDPNDKLKKDLADKKKRKEEEEERNRELRKRRNKKEEDADSNIMRRLMLASLLVGVMNAIFRKMLQQPPPMAPAPPVVVWPPPASGPGAPSFSGPDGESGAIPPPTTTGSTIMPSSPGLPEILPQFDIPTGAFAVPPSGPVSISDYDRGLADGTLRGQIDGRADGTEDGMKEGVGIDNDTEEAILDELMKEDKKSEQIVADGIAKMEHNMYCGQIEKEGIARKINVRASFPRCLDYFTLMGTPDMIEYGEDTVEYGEEKSTYGQADSEYGEAPSALPEQPTGAVSGEPVAEVSGEPANAVSVEPANAVSVETADAVSGEPQEGGYRETSDGIMQYGGKYTISIAEPTLPYDIGYAKGYKDAYESAFNLAYTVTKMTMLMEIVRKKLNDNSGIEYGEDLAQYGSVGSEYGNAEGTYGEVSAQPANAVSGEPANAVSGEPANAVSGEPANAVSGEPQEGGYLKKLRSAMRSKGPSKEAARLLKRIVSKTTGL
jgi:hypothetical protein